MHSHTKISFTKDDLNQIIGELSPELDKMIKEKKELLEIFNKLNGIAIDIQKISANLITSSTLLTEIGSSSNKEKYTSTLRQIGTNGFLVTTANTNFDKLKLDIAQFIKLNPQSSSLNEINQKINMVDDKLKEVATKQQSQQTQITNTIKALSSKNTQVPPKTSFKV